MQRWPVRCGVGQINPTTPPSNSPTTTIPISRAGLSLVPNTEIAQSLTPGGAESTTQSATPWISEGAPIAPASSSEIPNERATETAPINGRRRSIIRPAVRPGCPMGFRFE